MKKNAYLERQKADKKAFMNSVELIVKQYCIDLMALMDQWKANRDKYQDAINPDLVEADVAQAHVDRIMERIIRGKMELIPFEERYPTLKKIKY